MTAPRRGYYLGVNRLSTPRLRAAPPCGKILHMKTAETQIRVSSDAAAVLAMLRDRYRFASMAAVVDRLLLLYKKEFVEHQDTALTPRTAKEAGDG